MILPTTYAAQLFTAGFFAGWVVVTVCRWGCQWGLGAAWRWCR